MRLIDADEFLLTTKVGYTLALTYIARSPPPLQVGEDVTVYN